MTSILSRPTRGEGGGGPLNPPPRIALYRAQCHALYALRGRVFKFGLGPGQEPYLPGAAPRAHDSAELPRKCVAVRAEVLDENLLSNPVTEGPDVRSR